MMTMAMTNITLRLPSTLLIQLKLLADQKQISISALLIEQLTNLAQHEYEYQQAKRRFIAYVEEGFELGLNDHISWTRESIYEP